MASRAQVVIDLIVNSSGASRELDQAAGKFGKFQQGLGKLAAPAAAVVGVLAGIGAAAGKAASDTQQAFGGLDAVFGANSEQVKAWANTAATSVGLSASAYAEFAAKIGAQLKNAGVPMDQIAGKTDELVRLGADLAATYGGTTADAVDALGAALRGEADPAERYGLALNQTRINAELAAKGQDKLTGTALATAKAQTVMALATQQAGGAVGQFARESDSAAGAAQIAQAQWQNALSILGTALLPAMAQAGTALAGMATFVTQNARAFQVLAVVIASVAAAILLANAAISVYTTVVTIIPAITKAWAGAQWLLNAALTANPIGIVIVAIVALVVAIVLLWKKSETFRAVVMAVWAAIKVGWAAVVAAFQAGVAWVVAAWDAVVAAIKAAWAFIVAYVTVVVNWFRSVWSTIATAAAAAWNAILTIVTAVVSKIVAFAKGMALPYVLAFQLIRAVASVVFQFIRLGFQILAAVAVTVANRIRAIFVLGFNAVKSAASAVTAWIRSKFTALTGPLLAVANRIKAGFVAGWNAIKSAAGVMANWIRSKITGMVGPIISAVNRIKSAFTSAWNAIKSAASAAASFIKSKFQAIAGPITSVANKIKSTFTSALNAIKSAASAAGGAVSRAFSGIKGTIEGIIGAVRRLISALRSIKVPSIKIPKLGGASRAAAMPQGYSLRSPSAGPSILRAGYVSGAGTSDGPAVITVTVNGALDPEAVARQIERVLSSAQRRRSGVTLRQRANTVAAPV